MALTPLQRLSARLFAAAARRIQKLATWVRIQPQLAAWFFPVNGEDPALLYREVNGRMFANLYEQERMLADQPRMNFYAEVIRRHVQPGDRVIDLGTGTGILAAWASRRGAARVYAIDHSEILEHAKTIARHNQIQNVEFIHVHSSAFVLQEKVDVIVHEQMGDCLFDEGMVANVLDLRDRLLKPGGLILPSKFELYCEPVKLKDERLVPFLWELNVHGYDYSCMERCRPQETQYYHRSSSDLGFVDHFLGDPEPVLTIDLQTLHESDIPLDLHFTRRVEKEGRLDGYVVYFRTFVDDDLSLGSGPLDPARAPHWGFRFLRTDRDEFYVGDWIDVHLHVGRWSDSDTWRWTHTKRRCDELMGVS
jgi:protein arginine N-methyltransferase 1